ncbi:flagellar basal body rod protein FlgC [Collimonas sp.]|jgi:flagellar basal-body rod protein FlgC|uniref:flagellar basal body rod protein FlgC n=1 Tax=Collimonas sp. TaxID=1963772 RepID=UPI002BC27CC1|nr:flagellar basal body rod protein FlgC [Collimonas sp.]HWW08318.1 flagellar basal body rod protein FlgC [Collimonas sp.]
MDYTHTFAISAAGMSVERTRVDVAALNLANAQTLQSADGKSYQPLQVVARTAGSDAASFNYLVSRGLQGGADFTQNLPVASVEASNASPRQVYEPGHPFANAQGFISYPGVDPAKEMVSLMTAMRSYEANVAAMNAARTMALKALDIGG